MQLRACDRARYLSLNILAAKWLQTCPNPTSTSGEKCDFIFFWNCYLSVNIFLLEKSISLLAIRSTIHISSSPKLVFFYSYWPFLARQQPRHGRWAHQRWASPRGHRHRHCGPWWYGVGGELRGWRNVRPPMEWGGGLWHRGERGEATCCRCGRSSRHGESGSKGEVQPGLGEQKARDLVIRDRDETHAWQRWRCGSRQG